MRPLCMKDYTKTQKLLYAGIFGVLIFLILPGIYKLISFFLVAITLSHVYSKHSFNLNILILLSSVFILIPSSFLTLNASLPVYTPGTGSNTIISNGGQTPTTTTLSTSDIFTYNTGSTIETWVAIILNILMIALPSLMFIGVVWAYMSGKIDEGTSTLIKLFIIIALTFAFCWLASAMGWDTFGILTPITALQEKIVDWVNNFSYDSESGKVGSEFYEFFGTATSQNTTEMVMRRQFFLASTFPFFLSLISVFLGLLHKYAKVPIKYPNVLENESEMELEFSQKKQFNAMILIFLLFELIASLFFYLSFDNEMLAVYTQIYLFILYLLITAVLSLLLALGYGVYTKNKPKETIYGVVMGIAGMFLFFNMFTQTQYLDAMSNEYTLTTTQNIIVQALFVAPTESLIYHVFIPAFALYLLQNKTTTEKMELMLLEIKKQEILIKMHKENADSRKAVITMGILENNKEEIRKINKKMNKTTTNLDSKSTLIFWFVVLMSNLTFSLMHFPRSNLSFIFFWSSGLGFIYLSTGVWLTYLSYRYGWSTSIFVHFLNNLITILLIGGL
jgi:hypothetical protein